MRRSCTCPRMQRLSGTNGRTLHSRRRSRRCSGTRGGSWFFRCNDWLFGRNYGLGLVENGDLIFHQGLGWLRRFRCNRRLRCRRNRSRRLRTGDYRRRRTRHRLRRNESRRRLRLCRGCWLRAGADGRSRRCRLRRNGGRRRNGRPCHAGRSMGGGRNRTRRRGRLSGALRDRLQHIAWLGDVRQVDLWLELVCSWRGRARAATCAGLMLGKVIFYALGFVFFDRTGVRFLFRYADLGQNFEDGLALHLEFSGQIVNSNLVLHSALFPPLCPVWLRLHSILTVWVLRFPRLKPLATGNKAAFFGTTEVMS
jgi:hypothetical protein